MAGAPTLKSACLATAEDLSETPALNGTTMIVCCSLIPATLYILITLSRSMQKSNDVWRM